jgi:hypothetical protein
MITPSQSAALNGLSAVRSSVAGIHKRTVRSTAAAEAVAVRRHYPVRQYEYFPKLPEELPEDARPRLG